ncbi:MAG: MMPL family transporter [SAR324 cluster bacterium]|nr:MMPL family transporter [SAR324 cluster bacterium]
MLLRSFYDQIILKYSKTVLLLILLGVAFLGYEARKLEIDASSETLLLEDDKDLEYTRLINQRYFTPDFLVISYTPSDDLLSDRVLGTIRSMSQDLLKLKRVESVTSILNVPLLESPPKPIAELIENVPTLESPNIDKELAKKEFLNSPIYQDNLVSEDFKTTALLVNLHDDHRNRELRERRDELRAKEKNGTLTTEEEVEFQKVQVDYKAHRDMMRAVESENVAEVRAILDRYRGEDKLFLGGLTMIADDLVTFIKNDLQIFGVGVLIFLIVTLSFIFRQLRWVVLPVLTCSFSVVATTGLLGMFGWEVTVISSNFISLQLIITMAITIHLIVRYRELARTHPEKDQHELVLDTVVFMALPCLYAVLTTVAGFSSLILSGILPVINFGWMMSAGVSVSLLMTFLLFPALQLQMNKLMPDLSFENRYSLTLVFSRFTDRYGNGILWFSGLLLLVSVVGGTRLMVENSFIDYFKESTEIYQGLKVIDQKLGGTTTLDVVLNFEEEEVEEVEDEPVEEHESEGDLNEEEDEDLEDFSDLEEEIAEEEEGAQYWFTTNRMEQLEALHNYLDGLPETGKVLSLATLLKVGKTINDGKPLDNFMLALVYNELPEEFRKIILSPYVSVENNQARVSVRIRDSQPDLRRNELIKKIRRELKEKLELPEERTRLASLLILYNNMLQSLFNSQIKTLGAVVVVLFVMFLILFRSITISLIGLFPNMLSIGSVLGFMGWAGIPLDLMTITIAAISMGIAVDNTIHYIYRFKYEFEHDRNYTETMHRAHSSIGYAMYYTSITVIIGFSILVISNFIPSIYFGLLTGMAMFIALFAALTLLPQLIISIKPFGPEKATI